MEILVDSVAVSVKGPFLGCPDSKSLIIWDPDFWKLPYRYETEAGFIVNVC